MSNFLMSINFWRCVMKNLLCNKIRLLCAIFMIFLSVLTLKAIANDFNKGVDYYKAEQKLELYLFLPHKLLCPVRACSSDG